MLLRFSFLSALSKSVSFLFLSLVFNVQFDSSFDIFHKYVYNLGFNSFLSKFLHRSQADNKFASSFLSPSQFP